jgi:hypothetical protein
MGRLQKITAEEVLETLAEKDHVTVSELADLYEVCPATIRSRLRELRGEGNPIIHGGNGIMLISREELENDINIAETLRTFNSWIVSMVIGMVKCSKPTQPLFPVLRKSLKESLTSEERKQLATSCVRIKGLIDYIEMDGEDESL